ncbi:hypothetical protein GCM10011332_02640 [Terasakiella brassicae]|uniref:DUF4156 domain-containing protein n=1 Tax=Terasakiella brassicae TaxID=1634917 RepID=A0A917F5Z5_9PROT|nr:hypothetical protein [Terasakiella brassicae]GGF52862.1 hypothetical protein GCM10011332_02640 [Terasakiella brassicae]
MKKVVFAVSVLMSLNACETSTNIKPIDYGVVVAAQKDVEECTLLGDVHGVSSLYGLFVEQGTTNARNQALNKAGEMGATHIVWGQFVGGHGSTSAHGMAYLCK